MRRIVARRLYLGDVVAEAPVACPFCGAALELETWHSCRELQMDERHPEPTLEALGLAPPKVPNWMLAAIAVLVLSYLGAHLLVALGVPCPS